MSLCIQANRTDSHFSGSYLLVALMGGTFDIRVVQHVWLVRSFGVWKSGCVVAVLCTLLGPEGPGSLSVVWYLFTA
ncbi:hypothetical protein GCM10011399_38550 [Subtercola lobariae]|uniref:Uncharacterized protein n=1 Tax=Subtercola lobariae TaxID=1588641 RepID=A0A917BHZ5_9MICO|nr:hypothetical protein GCM10011399_38550 [Subtercola lobariae]